MEKSQNTQSRSGAGFLGITALILITLFAYAPTAEAGKPMADPPPEVAEVLCDGSEIAGADADQDGFTDVEECNAGITLMDETPFPACNGAAHLDCLDPNEPDLFVILVEATARNVWDCSTNSTRYDVQPHIDNGIIVDNTGAMDALDLLSQLGVTVHKLPDDYYVMLPGDYDDSGRSVTNTQKAVKITESLDVCGTIVGVSSYSTPNGTDNARVYTQRIADFVTDAIGSKTDIKLNGNGSSAAAIIEAYIAFTVAHEAGHSLKLVPVAYQNDRFGIYHWKTGSDFIMDQNVVVSSKGSGVNFDIPGDFAGPSVTGKLLAGN